LAIRKFISIILVIAGLCWAQIGRAQTPLLRELKLTDEGRALEITSAVIDHQGVIWVIAKSGVYFSTADRVTRALSIEQSGSELTTIYHDRNGVVWVGNAKGKIFKFINYTKAAFNPAEGMPAKPISQFMEDTRGNLWISTQGEGIYIYDGKHFYNLNQDDGLSDNYVYCILPSGKDNIICGTDIGINYCTFSKGKKKVIKIVGAESGLEDEIVRDITYVSKNLLAIGTHEAGVQFYNEISGSVMKLGTQTVGTVNTLCNINGELWAGFQNDGIYDFEFRNPTRIRNLNLIGMYGIKSVQKIINSPFYSQIVVAENKLYVTPGEWYETWATPEIVKGKKPKAIATDQNLLVVAYENAIVYRQLSSDWKQLNLSENGFAFKAISCMNIDRYGHLWIGSLNDGLICVDINGKVLKRFASKTGLMNNNVYCMAEYGNLMLYGSMNGIGAVHTQTLMPSDKAYPAIDALGKTMGQYVYDIAIARDSSILFGSDGHGIGVIKNNTLKFIVPGGEKEKNIVLCLEAARDNSFWYSSMYYGLFRYNEGKIAGFPNLISVNKSPINAMCSDSYNNIITVHDDFFSIYDAKTKQQFVVQNDFGFSGLDVSNNMIAGNKYQVFIATQNGIVIFQPARFRFMQNLPLIVQRQLLFLQPVNANNTLKNQFEYDQNHISFECNFPWFFNDEKVKYEYILEGYSKDTFVSSNALISFPNLSSGSYKFKVRGKLQNAILQNGWTVISFKINRPWYRTTWFIIAACLFITLTVYFIIRFRLDYYVKTAEARRFKLSQELRAMQSQVNPHFLFNSLSSLLALIDVDTEKAKTYTEKLSDFYRDIVKYKDTDLIPLAYELEITDTYLFLQNIRFDDAIVVVKNLDSAALSNARIAPLTLQILFENAIKHNKVGQGNQLEIHLETRDKGIEVSNNLNPKNYPESSTKSGLGFVKDRCRILTGREAEVTITDQHFIVFIPLVYN
jgi:ligand-binding sensor domain-containing protein